MSASTIPTKIRRGEETLRKLAAHRQQLQAERTARVETLSGQHVEGLEDHQVEGAEPIAGLVARCDAVAGFASVLEIEDARKAIDEVERGGTIETACEAVEQLEAAGDQRSVARLERELTLRELVERTGVKVVPGTEQWHADGRFTATAELPTGGTMPFLITGSGESGTTLLWHASRSDIRGDGTQEGECRAQEAKIDELAKRFGERMSVEGEGASPAEERPPHHVSRGAR